jgi:hypothetical protein
MNYVTTDPKTGK